MFERMLYLYKKIKDKTANGEDILEFNLLVDSHSLKRDYIIEQLEKHLKA